ncbi:exopolysaccharide biosynthesis protein [Bacillus sp. UMB0899]|nr:exopolysaccharide biosynthesis protein [Bacillus sp. UMB0899]
MNEQKKHPMDMLKSHLEKILNVIPPGSKIYFLDYPLYTNVGDLLIWKGTEQFFEKHDISVKARYSVINFPNDLEIPNDHIIVFQGGGNFGDLWKSHQRLRELVIKRYPNHKIVILPQTIYFKNKNNYNKSKRLFNKHKNLHIFARDKQSFKRLEGFSKNIYLSPDMAHELWPLKTTANPSKNVLYLLRQDKELNKNVEIQPDRIKVTKDWINLLTTKDKKVVQEIREEYKRLGVSDAASWIKFSDYLIDKAISLFSNHQEVITTRLHGHILACLLNKRNTFYNNSYGKNVEYYNAWTHTVQYTTFVKE